MSQLKYMSFKPRNNLFYKIFILTFQGYLNSETVVGRLFQGRRQNVVLATKFGVRVPKYMATDIEQSLTNSLQKLQTDYIDLYQVIDFKNIDI